MEKIKKFNEFVKTDTTSEELLNESRIGESVEYKGNIIQIMSYFPKENDEDRSFIKQNLNTIWNILQEAYSDKGGFKGIEHKSEVLKKVSMVRLGFLNEEIVAVDVYNDYLGGNKSIGIGCVKGEKHEAGVLLVKMIIKENINRWNDYVWSEVSGRVEDLYRELNGYNVKTEYFDIYMGESGEKEIIDEYYYKRRIHGKMETKTIFGIKNKPALDKLMEKEFEPLTTFLANKDGGFLNEDFSHSDYYRKLAPVELSIRVIYDFYGYHIDCGYNEFPENLYEKLKENVLFVERELKSGRCPADIARRAKDAVREGKKLLKETTPLKFMKF